MSGYSPAVSPSPAPAAPRELRFELTIRLPEGGFQVVEVARLLLTALLSEFRKACRHLVQLGPCPKCRCTDHRRRGGEARKLLTVLGEVCWHSPRGECSQCGHVWVEDGWGGAPHNGRRIDLQIQSALVRLGTIAGYAEGAELARDLGVWVSEQTVRRVSQAAGKALAAEERERSGRVERGEEPQPETAIAAGHRVEIVVDGQYVREQPGGATREVKTAVLRVVEREGSKLGGVLRQEYYSGWESSEEFAAAVYARAFGMGADLAAEISVIGDDADWIGRLAAERFETGKRLLEWWHLACDVRRRLKPASSGQAQRITSGVRHALWHGKRLEADDWLAIGEEQKGNDCPDERLAKACADLRGYLKERQAELTDYEAAQRRGEWIGSGAVEKSGEVLIGRRLKRRGRGWNPTNGDAMARLCCSRANGTLKDDAPRLLLAA